MEFLSAAALLYAVGGHSSTKRKPRNSDDVTKLTQLCNIPGISFESEYVTFAVIGGFYLFRALIKRHIDW
jgi:hypothetical protein